MPGEYPRRAGLAVTGGRNDSHTGARFGGVWPTRLLARSPVRRLLGATSLSTLLAADLAFAQTEAVVRSSGLSVDTVQVIQISMFAGVMGAALISAIALIRERARISAENVELRNRIADLNASLQRSDALLNLRDQRVVVWASEKQKPELIGALPAETGAPEDRSGFLAFGRWLMPR